MKIISGERDRNIEKKVYNVFKSCFINFSIALKLLVILFIIKIFARINIFKPIGKKHGQFILSNVRSLEHVKKEYSKVNQDINFIKTCRRENLIPPFAKVKIAIKINNNKLKQKLTRIILDTELQQKHNQRR